MRRRSLLLAVGAAGLTAGCVSLRAPRSDDPSPTGDRSTATSGPDEHSLVRHGTPPDVCSERADTGAIRAVVDPAFGSDWGGVDVHPRYRRRGAPDLAAEQVVIGLTDGGRARAYPLSVLWWHEVVNDRFDGPVLVTYCPLCRSGLVAHRRVAGRATTFEVSGLLWRPPDAHAEAQTAAGVVFGAAADAPEASVRNNGNLVLVDRATGSYWSQLLAAALCGPRAGETLGVRASSVSTWGAWRAAYPETEVMLPPPRSGLA